MSTRDATASRSVPLGLAVLAPLVALAVVATVPDGPAPTSPAGAVIETVPRSAVACPPAPVPRGATASVVGGAVPGETARAARPDAGGVGEPARTLPGGPGAVVELPAPAAEGAVLRGVGDAARGTFAARVDRDDRTLAVLRCEQPAAHWWFAGAGGNLDHSSVLHLANVDDGPAVVDVRLHGATQSVDVSGTQGLTLAPGRSLRLRLAELAPGSPELTVEVAASRGRVAAAVADTVDAGREWLPPTAPPGRRVVVPGGAAAAAGRATLLVTNPGDTQAVVDLQVLGRNGAFVPVDQEPVTVEPGAVAAVDLGGALGRAAAVRVLSEVPVVAALRTTVRGTTVRGTTVRGTTVRGTRRRGDHAVAAGGRPLEEGTPVVLVAAGRRTALRLAAGDEAATVHLVERTAGGRLRSQGEVRLPAGGSLQRVLGPRTASVTVTSKGGVLYAAAVHAGPGVAVQPAPPVPWTVVRPVVRAPAR
ncbi:MAG TPA: DUF5719 family protein [Marmoricola sp.]|nr:DUF5719 family protein [Marmoricola sp.]